MFFFIDTIGFTFFIKNFSTFPEYISEGTLDIILTKPVDSQFFVSLRYFSLISFLSIFPPLALLIRQLIVLNLEISIVNFITFLIFTAASLAIYYSLWFITNLILFWVERIDALHEFFITIWRFMQFPPDIFQSVIRLFFIFIVPILFSIVVPTQALQSIFEIKNILSLLLAAIFSLCMSRILWKIGLRRYQSTG
jgi:ABC-2 type transport system permease protein